MDRGAGEAERRMMVGGIVVAAEPTTQYDDGFSSNSPAAPCRRRRTLRHDTIRFHKRDRLTAPDGRRNFIEITRTEPDLPRYRINRIGRDRRYCWPPVSIGPTNASSFRVRRHGFAGIAVQLTPVNRTAAETVCVRRI